MALVNLAGEEVALTVIREAGPEAGDPTESGPRTVIVETLRSEAPLRYREWVNRNRQRVHEASQGRLGYVHIPDMGACRLRRVPPRLPAGSEAPRIDRGCALQPRWACLVLDPGKTGPPQGGLRGFALDADPETYPHYTIAGPMVALTNEYAGSDGDIFSHAFKLMKLGPLIGKRTWGGVIGINPSRFLVDGTITTQPEYAFWFSDVGWQVENYGTDPDIEVDIRPQDYAQGRDPQLERAIAEALAPLEANPPSQPDFSQKPSKAAPKLPPA